MSERVEPAPTSNPVGAASTRRQLLAAGLGGLATTVAAALVRPNAVRAGVDGDVVLGAYNYTESTTTIGGATGTRRALSASAGGSGDGVHGQSYQGAGVGGEGATFGVLGVSQDGPGVAGANHGFEHPAVLGHSEGNATGVEGFSGGEGSTPPAPKLKTGVYGYATQDSGARGVWGVSAAGQGVRGDATTGVGVSGSASNMAGYAFRGSGRVRFDKVSGLATIAAGTTSKVITLATDVTTESFVLLTPMVDLGTRRLWFTRDTTNNRITIRISSSRTTSTPISWLLLS